MRPIRRALALSAVSVVALAAATGTASAATGPASGATTAAAKQDIVETAVSAGKFKTLASLLKQAGLVKTLQGNGPFTVFAPTDAAFAKVPKKTLNALAKDRAKLRAVLLYHVAAGKLTAAKVVKRQSDQDRQRPERRRPRPQGQGVRRRRPRGHPRCPRLQRRHPRHQPGADPG